MPRRKSGDKTKFHSLNIAFNPDPLNLAALCDRKDGTNSPEVNSPILDRSHQYEPDIVQLFDINDPLNLNHVDDPSLIKPVCKRKKRKRRNTGGALTDTEELACLVNHITNESLDLSRNSSLVIEDPVKKTDKELDTSNSKLEKNKDSDQVLEKNIHRCNKRVRHNSYYKQLKFNEKGRKFRYGNYIDCNDGIRKHVVDQRLNFFSKEWFEGKCCLDVGCNTGKYCP